MCECVWGGGDVGGVGGLIYVYVRFVGCDIYFNIYICWLIYAYERDFVLKLLKKEKCYFLNLPRSILTRNLPSIERD